MNIYDGKFGGLSDSKHSGLAGSFYRCVGLDFHSKPGKIKVHQALAKDSATTVTALCKVALTVSSGETLWFSFTSGKIWRRSTGGTWLLVHTTTAAAGAHGCLGAMEHDGYIYWATQSRLHRIPITNIATAAHWTANAVEDWATFANTDLEFHPMARMFNALYIGDAHYVAKVSGVTGSHAFEDGSTILNLRSPNRIKTMIDYGIDILIGTFIHANVNKCEVLRWDAESETPTSRDQIDENGINAFIRDDNHVYVQAGRAGSIYYYNGELLLPYKIIPGDWSPTKTAQVNPNATATLFKRPVFGLSNIASNPCLEGVYQLGSYSKDYNKVLSLDFPISADLSDVEIGSILVVGSDLLVSWYDVGSSAYGVDKLNWSAKYASAYLETGILTPFNYRSELKNAVKIITNYAKALPASCAIVVKYKRKYEAGFTTMVGVEDTTLVQNVVSEVINKVAALQIKFEFTVNANDAPEIEFIEYLDK
ncbi:MAG: hypothetical protein KAR44_14885 [Candidatus Aegiribacteria sp.]|nr:hypothetical protein [Candidatus Aegiribacteria sp.]